MVTPRTKVYEERDGSLVETPEACVAVGKLSEILAQAGTNTFPV